MIDQNTVQSVAEIATEAAQPKKLDLDGSLYSVVIPEGAEAKLLDLEKYRLGPMRKKGHPTFWDAGSLAQYTNEHKELGTAIYFSDETYKIVAVINGHDEESAGWGDHRATLELRKTDQWKRWQAADDRLLDQESFAEHVERNLVDIIEPAGADLLELAQTFQATTKAEFKSSKLLGNGQRQFTYIEEIEARGGSTGQLTIPKQFKLGIAPFEGLHDYAVTARIRYRINAGRLTIGYILDNPRDIERAAFSDVVKEVGEKVDLIPLFGVPA